MARTIIVLAVLLFVEGCAFPPEFIPTTIRGAKCKSECAMGHQSCRANPYRQLYICKNIYASCIETCINIDVLSKQKKLE